MEVNADTVGHMAGLLSQTLESDAATRRNAELELMQNRCAVVRAYHQKITHVCRLNTKTLRSFVSAGCTRATGWCCCRFS